MNIPADSNFWPNVWNGLVEHFLVIVFIGLFIIVVHFIIKRLEALFAWLLPVKVYGKWYTFLVAHNPADPAFGSSVLADIHGIKKHEESELHQFMNWVWGTTRKRYNPTVRYIVRGKIVGEKLSLVYRSRDSADSGAILLEVRSQDLMRGFEIGCDAETGELYSNHYEWHRH